MPVKSKVLAAGNSDQGRVRRNNEDAWYVDADRGIFLVVDGIGGQAAGEKAAAIAVDRVRARLERLTGTAEQRVREAITMANNEILRAAQTNPEWAGMACVLTVAAFDNGSAVIGHVGDSRLYQIQRGAIRKITHDHSPVGEREDNSELTEAEAMRHPRRNEVFRDVGSEEHAPDDPNFIEVQRIPFEPDSALVLCSDGLSDQVPSQFIRETVERNAGHPEVAIRELIAEANLRGGKDNVTVVIVEGDQFTPPPTPVVVARPASSIFLGIAWFLAGLVLASAAAWLSRSMWIPAPVVTTPRVLTAGKGAAYPTITAAIAEARPGDTVEVLGGEYDEQVNLKTGVSLRSQLPGNAILRAAPMSAGPAIAAENITDARVSGFWIQADEKAPLSAGVTLNNSTVELSNLEISGARVGIDIRGNANPTLSGNAIHDSLAEGILISGPSQPWLLHNTIQRNKGAGLLARDGSHPALAGNVFEKNKVDLPADMPLDTIRAKNFFLDAKPPVPVPHPARTTPPAEGRKQ